MAILDKAIAEAETQICDEINNLLENVDSIKSKPRNRDTFKALNHILKQLREINNKEK